MNNTHTSNTNTATENVTVATENGLAAADGIATKGKSKISTDQVIALRTMAKMNPEMTHQQLKDALELRLSTIMVGRCIRGLSHGHIDMCGLDVVPFNHTPQIERRLEKKEARKAAKAAAKAERDAAKAAKKASKATMSAKLEKALDLIRQAIVAKNVDEAIGLVREAIAAEPEIATGPADVTVEQAPEPVVESAAYETEEEARALLAWVSLAEAAEAAPVAEPEYVTEPEAPATEAAPNYTVGKGGFTGEQISHIAALVNGGRSRKEVAALYNVSLSQIARVMQGKLAAK